ncbi:hypothetical protein DXG03_001573, partial [Asterophora parasitica]
NQSHMVQYKQSFWTIVTGAGDFGATKPAQIAKAASFMNDHPDIILATSCGGYTTQCEVAFITLTTHETETLGPLLRDALSTHGLPVDVRLEDDVRHYDFGPLELGRIADACKFIGPHFTVTQDYFTRLTNARGADVQWRIANLNNAFVSLQHENNNNAMVATMVATGLITIGRGMHTAYVAWTTHGSLAAIMSAILSSIGGAAMLIPETALLASIFGLVFWILKE